MRIIRIAYIKYDDYKDEIVLHGEISPKPISDRHYSILTDKTLPDIHGQD